MADIEVSLEPIDRCLTIVVKGTTTLGALIQTIEAHYQQTQCQTVIWDMIDADLSPIGSDELVNIIAASRNCSPHRPEAPTLFIGNNPFVYGMLRMYTQQAYMSRRSAPIEAFHSWEEANNWLAQWRSNTTDKQSIQ